MNLFQKFIAKFGGESGALARKSFVADWVRGNDLDDNATGAKLISPYAQSAWVYCAIRIIADTVAQIPFRICRMNKDGEGEEIVQAGAVVDLFNAPHPTMPRALFWQTLVSWELLRGESFLIALNSADEVVPVKKATRASRSNVAQLLPLCPDFIQHIVQGYTLAGFRFTGAPMSGPLESQVLLPEEIIHSREFNPHDFWRGMSPLTVAGLAASTDFAAAQFMKGMMTNNADTGVIVTTDQQVDDIQREQIMAALKERKRKAGTADRPLFLWGGAKIEKPTVAAADMQFLENRKLNRQEIGAIFKVPETMMGFSDQKNALSGGTAQDAEKLKFIENTIAPLCRRLEDAVRPIVKSFDPSFDCYFDEDSLPIMQEARRSRVDTAVKVFSMGVPLNDLNEVYDLGFPKYAWGDRAYLPFSLQAISDGGPIDPSEAEPAGPSAEGKDVRDASKAIARMMQLVDGGTGKKEGGTSAHQCAANPAFESAMSGAIKRTQSKLGKFFFLQGGRVLANLEKALSKGIQHGATTKSIDDIFNFADENEKLELLMKPLMRADLEFGGAQLFEEINAGEFALKPEDAVKYLASRKNVIDGVNQTTFDSLKSTLTDGLNSGEGYDALAKRVREVFNKASEGRAEVIAVTETNTAINAGRYTAMQRAKVPMKAWQTSHLENTRPTHVACEAQGPIPTDATFSNGLRFPGDPQGEAAEVINCRCFSYAVLDSKGNPKSEIRSTKFLTFEQWVERHRKPTT
jgi:HK97 family phage portal protein